MHHLSLDSVGIHHQLSLPLPLLKRLCCLSDEDIDNLNRGGHDPYKVFAAYAEAMKAKGQPTVILGTCQRISHVCMHHLSLDSVGIHHQLSLPLPLLSPVRGNGKIIQELESLFRGAGWRVIKVVWGRHWDNPDKVIKLFATSK
jgi:pyruvate dehydrogenase complex dehydrogenase (E1) component